MRQLYALVLCKTIASRCSLIWVCCCYFSFTTKYVSPLLCLQEIQSVQGKDSHLDNLAVSMLKPLSHQLATSGDALAPSSRLLIHQKSPVHRQYIAKWFAWRPIDAPVATHKRTSDDVLTTRSRPLTTSWRCTDDHWEHHDDHWRLLGELVKTYWQHGDVLKTLWRPSCHVIKEVYKESKTCPSIIIILHSPKCHLCRIFTPW